MYVENINFRKNQNFAQKSEWWSKIENFGQKSEWWSKIEIVVKNVDREGSICW